MFVYESTICYNSNDQKEMKEIKTKAEISSPKSEIKAEDSTLTERESEGNAPNDNKLINKVRKFFNAINPLP